MKTLLLIPSVLKKGVEEAVASDRHPVMDYYALANGLSQRSGDSAEFLDYRFLDETTDPMLRLLCRTAGKDAALAYAGFRRRHEYDAIFTNGENVGIPLALLLKSTGRSVPHVTIGHRPSTGKKRLFFQRFRAQERMDRIFLYATSQLKIAQEELGIDEKRLSLIAFHADTRFYRPMPNIPVNENQICSAGLEWRDYPTLIEAVRDMPDLSVKLAAASPWSKHRNETENRELPSHVSARRYEYNELRELYAGSSFVVVPLYENDFQAGVTTILEAMAMGKAVIATQTTGQTDVIVDGENGLTVAPGDVTGWRDAIQRLRHDAALRERLGRNARRWMEENATLDLWVENITDALRQSASSTNSVPSSLITKTENSQ
ncbi:MAG: glycosyltransferase family 4 protein [Armatimonadaceae bacterium]